MNHGAKQVFVHVVVGVDVFSLDEMVSIKFHFLTSDTRTSDNSVFNLRSISQCKRLNLVEVFSLSSNGSIDDVLRKLNIVFAISNEVGFTLQGDDSTEAISSLYKYATVRGFAV